MNKNKCKFFIDSIKHCGYVLDKNRIASQIAEKMAAINRRIRMKFDHLSALFIGNYYGRFFQNLGTVLYPINNLLKTDVPFK